MEATSRDTVSKLLSDRQFECARLAAKGLTSKEIARELNISPSTVDNHIKFALTALGVSRRTLLSDFFKENDLESSDRNKKKVFEFKRSYPDNRDVFDGKITQDFPQIFPNNNNFYAYSFFFLAGLMAAIFLASILYFKYVLS